MFYVLFYFALYMAAQPNVASSLRVKLRFLCGCLVVMICSKTLLVCFKNNGAKKTDEQ